ncbi:MAG: hypothetical protein WA705_31525 [Candidatus Ozemobacteraceae bacterium]
MNMRTLLKVLGFLIIFSGLTGAEAQPGKNELEKQRLLCKLCADFQVVPYGIAETAHAKVLLHPNQYYLGRVVVISKLDKKDSGLVHYSNMEWLFKNRPEIHAELMSVVYATQEARRRWLAENKLAAPELFNELLASNLAYGKDKLLGLPPSPHAHIHSWMRYSSPMRLSFSTDFSDINLSDSSSRPLSGKESALFVDTEFGAPILFENLSDELAYASLPTERKKWISTSNDHLRSLPDPLMRWITSSLRKHLLPLLPEK